MGIIPEMAIKEMQNNRVFALCLYLELKSKTEYRKPQKKASCKIAERL